VGWAVHSSAPTRVEAFLWRAGFTYYLCDLGNIGGSVDVDINAHGQVVGSANNKKYVLGNGNTVLLDEAFLWENGTVTPLGTLGYDSHAYAINDNGQIVGDANYACIWDGGVIHDLTEMIVNAPGWELTTAYDINELGQIVGVGFDPSTHQQHGFLLTPIPEPATLSLLALGALALLGRRR
jgi:probable HAF family extracellular repeat protein